MTDIHDWTNNDHRTVARQLLKRAYDQHQEDKANGLADNPTVLALIAVGHAIISTDHGTDNEAW